MKRIGLEVCVDGQWSGVCEGAVYPEDEICDGLDNDCNNSSEIQVRHGITNAQQIFSANFTQILTPQDCTYPYICDFWDSHSIRPCGGRRLDARLRT